MNKLILLFFFFSINTTYTQEIESIYMFKKEIKNKNGFPYVESDSLAFCSNGTFYRKKFFWNHEVITDEFKGNWKLNKNLLELSIIFRNGFIEEEIKRNRIRIYKLRRTKLIPLLGFDGEFNVRKLKKL